MNKLLLFAALALLLFGSCVSETDRRIQDLYEAPGIPEAPRPFTITDFRNRAEGQSKPEWVNHWLEGGIHAVETLDAHEGRYVFISRNNGSNFKALSQWAQWFSPELDFPRLAAARVEARFLSGVSRPDNVYGSFFIALISAASDALWTGAIKEDYFWIRREFYPAEDDFFGAGVNAGNNGSPLPEEDWEFLILVTIDETLFASQLDGIFRGIRPIPQPTREQTNAANRVIERFFDGF